MSAFVWPFEDLAIRSRVRVIDYGGEWHGRFGEVVGCAPGPGEESPLGDGPVVVVKIDAGPTLWVLPAYLERADGPARAL